MQSAVPRVLKFVSKELFHLSLVRYSVEHADHERDRQQEHNGQEPDALCAGRDALPHHRSVGGGSDWFRYNVVGSLVGTLTQRRWLRLCCAHFLLASHIDAHYPGSGSNGKRQL